MVQMMMKACSKSRDTSWQRLDRAFRTTLSVSKDALVKKEAKLKRLHQKTRAKKPSRD